MLKDTVEVDMIWQDSSLGSVFSVEQVIYIHVTFSPPIRWDCFDGFWTNEFSCSIRHETSSLLSKFPSVESRHNETAAQNSLKAWRIQMQMFAAAECTVICSKHVLTPRWGVLTAASQQDVFHAERLHVQYRGINKALPFHPEFSWLIVPFRVILDDFNFKWSFPKLPVISSNHILIKMCVHAGGASDTSSLPVWLAEVPTCLCQEKGLCAHM